MLASGDVIAPPHPVRALDSTSSSIKKIIVVVVVVVLVVVVVVVIVLGMRGPWGL